MWSQGIHLQIGSVSGFRQAVSCSLPRQTNTGCSIFSVYSVWTDSVCWPSAFLIRLRGPSPQAWMQDFSHTAGCMLECISLLHDGYPLLLNKCLLIYNTEDMLAYTSAIPREFMYFNSAALRCKNTSVRLPGQHLQVTTDWTVTILCRFLLRFKKVWTGVETHVQEWGQGAGAHSSKHSYIHDFTCP